MAQTDESGGMSPARDPLNGRLRALRLALIILPLIGLVISIAAFTYFVAGTDAALADQSFVFVTVRYFLHTLPYQALCLWAGLTMSPRPETGPKKSSLKLPRKFPVESRVISLLKWFLIGCALILAVIKLVHFGGAIAGWVTNLTNGGAYLLTHNAGELFIAVSFAAICIAVTRQNSGAETSRAAAVLRVALIIIPLLAVSLTVLSSWISFIEMSLNQFDHPFTTHIEPLIIPLAYLAIGVWAAHLIKPFNGLDFETMRWSLIFLGAALPILIIITQYQVYESAYREHRGKPFVSYLLTGGLRSLLGGLSFGLNLLLFNLICFFFAHKMDEAGEKKGVGYSA